MTTIIIQREKTGELVSFCADGHAGYSKSGSDIVCSAITILMRTALQVISESKTLKFKVNDKKTGFLSFDVENGGVFTEEDKILLKYSGQFLEKGFKSLAQEFPEYVKFVDNILGEYHGKN